MHAGSIPAYTSPSTRCMCARIAGILAPLVPHMPSLPTLPRSRRSSITSATTPVDLSESLAPWPVKPVVYSPVPSMRTPGGMVLGWLTSHLVKF